MLQHLGFGVGGPSSRRRHIFGTKNGHLNQRIKIIQNVHIIVTQPTVMSSQRVLLLRRKFQGFMLTTLDIGIPP